MRKFMKSAKGAALVEYGILVGLISVLAIGAVIALGQQVDETFTTVSTELSSYINAAASN